MKLKYGLLVAVFASVLCIFTSCAPSKSKVYTVGDTYFLVSNDGAKTGTIKLDSVEYSINEDGETCNLGLTYIIYPETTIQLDSQKIFVSCEDTKYFTDKQKNLERNGRDIFGFSIEEEIRYVFFFVIPKFPYFDNMDNREEGYLGWGIDCYIEDAKFEVYTKVIYDSL